MANQKITIVISNQLYLNGLGDKHYALIMKIFIYFFVAIGLFLPWVLGFYVGFLKLFQLKTHFTTTKFIRFFIG